MKYLFCFLLLLLSFYDLYAMRGLKALVAKCKNQVAPNARSVEVVNLSGEWNFIALEGIVEENLIAIAPEFRRQEAQRLIKELKEAIEHKKLSSQEVYSIALSSVPAPDNKYGSDALHFRFNFHDKRAPLVVSIADSENVLFAKSDPGEKLVKNEDSSPDDLVGVALKKVKGVEQDTLRAAFELELGRMGVLEIQLKKVEFLGIRPSNEGLVKSLYDFRIRVEGHNLPLTLTVAPLPKIQDAQ